MQNTDKDETYGSFFHHSCLRSRSTHHSVALFWCSSRKCTQTDQGKLEMKFMGVKTGRQSELNTKEKWKSSNDRIMWSVGFKWSWFKISSPDFIWPYRNTGLTYGLQGQRQCKRSWIPYQCRIHRNGTSLPRYWWR